jgi:hypothetical protein
MRYGVVVWGGSRESIKILRLPKKVVRMMIGLKMCEPCRQKFKELRILTVISYEEIQRKCNGKLCDT